MERELTPTEMKLVGDIVKKGMKLAQDWDIEVGKTVDVYLDIENTHKVMPLRLDEFAADESSDFSHDFFGIIRNFNRSTKTMDNFFVPRFAVQ